jgi:hypothetical protein
LDFDFQEGGGFAGFVESHNAGLGIPRRRCENACAGGLTGTWKGNRNQVPRRRGEKACAGGLMWHLERKQEPGATAPLHNSPERSNIGCGGWSCTSMAQFMRLAPISLSPR